MSHSDSLVLDIGGDTGALVIYASADHNETEIEISPGRSRKAPRSHNVVHPRHNRHGINYSAVFPAVPAGDYTIWRHDGKIAAFITIRGGEVTEHHWEH